MSKLDAEYKAMRRRMSNLRVACGKQKTALEAEDIPSSKDPNDTGFKDLVKFWKKHGIPINNELLSDMAEENVKQAAAKGRGRRRSRELEDLHLCASTGKFKLEKITPLFEESDTPPSGTPPGKKKLTRLQSESVINPASPGISPATPRGKKTITRMQSEFSVVNRSKGASIKKTTPSVNGQTNKKLSRSISKT